MKHDNTSMWDALVDRQTGFRGFTPQLNAAIRHTQVAVIGAGGNGSVLDLLVRCGFTHFTIIDPDIVEATNLNRLPFGCDSIGLHKVTAWKKHLLSINPECEIATHVQPVTGTNSEWLATTLQGVQLIFLGTTDVGANLVTGEIAAQRHIRTLIGPASSGCWVVTTFTHDNSHTIASIGKFDCAPDNRQEDADWIKTRYRELLNFPGRECALEPSVAQAVFAEEIPARSCGIFVRLVNAAMAFEAVKNIAEMSGLPVPGQRVIKIPEVQIFNPWVFSSYIYDIEKGTLTYPTMGKTAEW